MKLDQLSYFAETAQSKNIGKAAKKLAISPSAISHSITSLEEELGLKLFSREDKKMTLTSQGIVLLNYVQSILAQVSEIKEIASPKKLITGHFKFAATHGLDRSILGPVLARLCQSHSSLTAEIQSLRSSDIVEKIISSEIDFGLCYSPLSHPKIKKKIIHQGNLTIAVRPGHPIFLLPAEKQLEGLNQYSTLSVKFSKGIENCELHPMIEQAGVRSKTILYYDSYETAIGSVQGSDSWILVPDWIVEKSSLATITSPKLKASYEIAAITTTSRFQTKVSSYFLRKIEQFIKSHNKYQ